MTVPAVSTMALPPRHRTLRRRLGAVLHAVQLPVVVEVFHRGVGAQDVVSSVRRCKLCEVGYWRRPAGVEVVGIPRHYLGQPHPGERRSDAPMGMVNQCMQSALIGTNSTCETSLDADRKIPIPAWPPFEWV